MVYVVTLWHASNDFVIVGVFSDEQKAIAACRTPNHGYGPIQLDKDTGDELTDWADFRYPMREEQ